MDNKLSGFIAKLKSIKHVEIIACVAVLAVVLIIYFSCVSCSDESVRTSAGVDLTNADYCTAMQVQVENAISQISGVGSAAVVINWDKSVSSSFGSASSENPQAVGALIVCDGGDSTKVKLDVIYAVSTLLNLSIENIIVYPKSH